MWRPSVTPSEVIMHYQVKGAKHGKRRYQYNDGSLTPLGREHYGIGPARKAGESLITKATNVIRGARIERANKKKAKAQQQRLEKARQTRKANAAAKKQAEENARREAERKEMDAKEVERIINSGSPEEVAKVKGRATNDQLQYALTRFEKEAAIDSAINKRRAKTGYEKFMEYSDKVGKVATASSNFINLYNNGAKVYNAFYGDKNNKKLPSI